MNVLSFIYKDPVDFSLQACCQPQCAWATKSEESRAYNHRKQKEKNDTSHSKYIINNALNDRCHSKYIKNSAVDDICQSEYLKSSEIDDITPVKL